MHMHADTQAITTQVAWQAWRLHRGSRSEVILEIVVYAFCSETASEIVISSGDPSAQVSDHGLAQSVFSEVVVREDADTS